MEAVKYKIQINPVAESRVDSIDFNNLPFGHFVSDHMMAADCINGVWQNAEIKPYGSLQLVPSTSALHYGQAIFEGMKAYRSPEGEALLFNPKANWKRLNLSAKRMCMPEIPWELFYEGLKALISLDRNWIPEAEGSSLYIRPFFFATDAHTGIRISETYKFIIYSCPVGKYYSEPVNLLATAKYVRAFPGGTGEAKAAGNYAGALLATKEAKEAGYDNVLWLDGKKHKYVEEVGTMNVMFVIDGVVVTPPLSGTILHGTTRAAVIELIQERGMEVQERRIGIAELWKAHSRGKLQEAFGIGTAATVAPIAMIGHDGTLVEFQDPEDEYLFEQTEIHLEGGHTIATELLKRLTDIRTGKVEDPFGWVERV
jgi:branched-chain amino acid aminotransferase